jgi:hypothetical protein
MEIFDQLAVYILHNANYAKYWRWLFGEPVPMPA